MHFTLCAVNNQIVSLFINPNVLKLFGPPEELVRVGASGEGNSARENKHATRGGEADEENAQQRKPGSIYVFLMF
jgi:hypothetical protein